MGSHEETRCPRCGKVETRYREVYSPDLWEAGIRCYGCHHLEPLSLKELRQRLDLQIWALRKYFNLVHFVKGIFKDLILLYRVGRFSR